jgi:3-hydroxy acid dehydrogenase / malonic semialdehyde reductase
MQKLSGKTALVTGASSGIGAAVARALSEAGANVVLAARRRARLERLAAELPRSEVLELDVRDAGAVLEALGTRPFDIAVVNAGLALGTDRLHTGDPADWSVVIDTNVKGVLHVLRAITPGMLARKRGDVVLLGSVAGRHVYPGGNVYCASKHAVRALYEAMRLDLEGHGLRFSTVDPGLVATEFSEVRFKGDKAKADAVYKGFEPLRPADVADAIAFIVTRPPHVNIGELVLWPTAQASVTSVTKSPSP